MKKILLILLILAVFITACTPFSTKKAPIHFPDSKWESTDGVFSFEVKKTIENKKVSIDCIGTMIIDEIIYDVYFILSSAELYLGIIYLEDYDLFKSNEQVDIEYIIESRVTFKNNKMIAEIYSNNIDSQYNNEVITFNRII